MVSRIENRFYTFFACKIKLVYFILFFYFLDFFENLFDFLIFSEILPKKNSRIIQKVENLPSNSLPRNCCFKLLSPWERPVWCQLTVKRMHVGQYETT